jgi:hypothetical protein
MAKNGAPTGGGRHGQLCENRLALGREGAYSPVCRHTHPGERASRISSAVEQRFCKPKVGGSIPSSGTSLHAIPQTNSVYFSSVALAWPSIAGALRYGDHAQVKYRGGDSGGTSWGRTRSGARLSTRPPQLLLSWLCRHAGHQPAIQTRPPASRATTRARRWKRGRATRPVPVPPSSSSCATRST